MDSETKLTAPQLALLRWLPTGATREYRPAQQLVAIGLAEWPRDDSDKLVITDAGRAILSKATQPQDTAP